MQHSESITKLAGALAKAQGEMENAAKSSDNPFFRSKYADLAEIINTSRAVLAKHGLSIVQFPGFDGSTVTLENVLMHESGEWISGLSGAPMPVMTTKDGRELPPSPQGVGSAITYLRRYSMAALCMIAQEDDDAEAASNGQSVRAPYQDPRPAQRPAPSSEPNGVKHSNVAGFDLDAKAAGKKAGGKTWRELIADEKEGRGYVEWCARKPFPDAETALHLQAALALAKLGDPDFTNEMGVGLPGAVGR